MVSIKVPNTIPNNKQNLLFSIFYFLSDDLMNFCRVIIAHFYYLTHELMDGQEVGKELCRVDETKNPIPKPIFGLPCHDKCKDGESASVSLNQTKLDYYCDKCPANTYSIGGGGIRIDGAMGAFNFHGEDGNVMPLQMEESCQVHATT